MKYKHLAALVWLAASTGALAQFSHTGASSASELYGAGPSTPPQMFNQPPPVAPASANTATKGTANSTTTPAAPSMLTVPVDAAVPGNATTASTSGSSASAGLPTVPMAPDLANVVMPTSMALIDNQRVLAPGDQFVYQVMEDHDAPVVLFVNVNGEAAPSVPYLPTQLHIRAEKLTLRQLAQNIKEQLESKDLGYYDHATVLLAPYHAGNSRGHVTIDGQVAKPGQVPVPANGEITLWQALTAAGWFTASADREHVQLIHNDVDDSKNSFQKEFNIQDDIDKGVETSTIVQPGDFIKVLSKAESNSVITVTGEVRQQLVLPVSNSNPPKILEVMIQAGFTDWSSRTVQLVRYKDGKRLPDQYINIEDITVRGDQGKNITLQPGDMIIVKANWYSFR